MLKELTLTGEIDKVEVAMARNKPLADTSAVMSMHGKMMGMRKLAWLLNLIDTAKAVEIDNKKGRRGKWGSMSAKRAHAVKECGAMYAGRKGTTLNAGVSYTSAVTR